MIHLDAEINELKEKLGTMWELVSTQLDKTLTAMNNFDKDLALEIQENEKRVNAYELNIDKECEDFIALRQPVATDLRFALSTLKINTNLERIADIASGIAEFISDIDQSVNPEIIHLLQAEKMLAISIEMVKDLREAYQYENTQLARTIFQRDKLLDQINDQASHRALECLDKFVDQRRQTLHVLSIVRKIERIGDQSKNIAEEIIFYLDAKVIKHAKKIKELDKEE
ncbi:MAG: phosphate signaling complex protein PhoU [Saprospiraceae bacterium]|nr:phosphate signaling complex protein PhoU [Candidatus Vicinibacter affinis]